MNDRLSRFRPLMMLPESAHKIPSADLLPNNFEYLTALTQIYFKPRLAESINCLVCHSKHGTKQINNTSCYLKFQLLSQSSVLRRDSARSCPESFREVVTRTEEAVATLEVIIIIFYKEKALNELALFFW